MHSPARASRVALALIAASTVALPLLPASVTPASAQVSGLTVSFGYFQDRLGRYGSWLHHPRWGDVWMPRGGPGFRPYYDGRWEFTSDVGWLWLSDDPWGEITDHYGRWVFDPGYGWLWVPGYPPWTGGGQPQDRSVGPQGRGRFGGGQVDGQLQGRGNNNAPVQNPQVQAAAPPQRAPQPSVAAPPRGGQDATDRNDPRRRGRGDDPTP